jgi:hypothetical protein
MSFVSTTAPDMVGKLVIASPPQTPISGAAGVPKVAVWSQPHDLKAIKGKGSG